MLKDPNRQSSLLAVVKHYNIWDLFKETLINVIPAQAGMTLIRRNDINQILLRN